MAVTVPRKTSGAASPDPAADLDGLIGVRRASSRPGALLGAALLAIILYAAFDDGGAGYPGEARLQIAFVLVAVIAVALWVWHGGLRLRAPVAAWAGLGLLAGFAVWSGLSLGWSITPSETWTQLNRTIAYVLAGAIAVAAGAWNRRALSQVAAGYAGIAIVVALYALGGKVVPQLIHHTDDFSRLRAPLDYWNALAIFLVMAVPILLRGAVDSAIQTRLRLGALAGMGVLIVTLGLTLSRGGVVAVVLAVGLCIGLAGEGARLRSLGFAGMALLAAAPALAVGFGAGDLTANGVPAGERSGEGALLGVALLVGLATLVLAGRAAIAAEARIAPDPARSRRIGRALLAALTALALLGVGAMAVSERGLTGTISHQADVFTTAKEASRFDPSRLYSTNSGNRWVWWEEAAGAWSDQPLQGWGAGSFALLHLRYRENDLQVLQPHSVPLQFLSETGLVGAVLALGGLAALLLAGLGTVRRLSPGPERGVAAALFAGAAAWAAQALYEWTYDIPAATLPALLFLGVLAGARPRETLDVTPPSTTGLKLGALAAATLLLCTVAISAGVPAWADGKSDAAARAVSGKPSAATLADADAEADLAARLDPLTVEPLYTAAAIAARRGRFAQARRYLLEALEREPENPAAWLRLIPTEELGSPVARFAVQRVLDLDPRNRRTSALASIYLLQLTPPAASATATGTPLPTIIPPEEPAAGTATTPGSGTTTTPGSGTAGNGD